MSDKQTEAQRLAALCDSEVVATVARDVMMHETAAELRRLHDLNQEALGALKDLADLYDTDEGCRSLPQYIAAREAIAKAEAAK